MITEMFKVELGGSVHLQSGPNKCVMHAILILKSLVDD